MNANPVRPDILPFRVAYIILHPMFGIASRYVKAKIKDPVFNIIYKYNIFSTSEYARQSLAFSCDIAASYAEHTTPTTLR